MKLKPVVASLVVAGLISSPALVTAKNLHQHHKHRGTTNTRPLHGKFAAQEALVSQNNAKSSVSNFDWTNRIHLSGSVNVDARYATRGPLGIVPQFKMSDDAHGLNVNNANLFVDADINKYVQAHVGFAYVADGVNLFDTGLHTNRGFVPFTESIRSDKGSVFAGGEVSVDEAYISIRDFAETPMFFRAGKMYLPFGTYSNPYPVSYSLAQLLSQTRATAAEVGFVTPYGFYGTAYILEGSQSSKNHADEVFGRYSDGEDYHTSEYSDYIPYTSVNNYGAKVGYRGCFHNIDVHANVGYIKDIRDTSYLSDIQELFGRSYVAPTSSGGEGEITTSFGPQGFGMQSAGGVATHADATYGSVNFSVDYVTAVRNLIRNTIENERHTDTRIWAADLTGSYGLGVWGYNTVLALSYQFSRQSGGIMPKWRYQGDYSVELFHNTSLTFEYRHDQAYDKNTDDNFSNFINYTASGQTSVDNVISGGTGHASNQATLRLGVAF